MGDEQGWWRDFQERPLGFPLLRLYNQFMNIKRYDHMPYYIYPSGVSVVSLEDKFINFLDWLVDAHEEARNPHDKNRHFYARSVFVMNNFLRYSNPTVCNVMFDTQAKRPQYDRLNSVISQQQTKFYLSAIAFHGLAFMYMSYFFRYRRVGFLPVVAISVAYTSVFENVNNILYKLLVDRPILREARSMGLDKHVQPAGTRKARSFNYI